VLVHNAGIWPARRELTADGYERAYALNHLGPLALQAPLLAAGKLSRVLVISAGLIAAGRIDPEKTPSGADFSALRTYASTKRAFAEATRGLAAQHPDVDFLVVHPGVVRTELGARPGLLGRVLSLVKRRWKRPKLALRAWPKRSTSRAGRSRGPRAGTSRTSPPPGPSSFAAAPGLGEPGWRARSRRLQCGNAETMPTRRGRSEDAPVASE
jgi:NAD(P)-dependent dehydrogenase (short-subunit alcohol dehydrogenase family)